MTTERDQMREMFFAAWRKQRAKLPLEPLEAQIIALIEQHPEYHEFFDHPEHVAETEFSGTNPFLHIALHLSIQEQVSTNRPQGIAEIYQTLCHRLGNKHAAEHAMLECLGLILWEAQQAGKAPDEAVYLENLRKIR